MVKKNEQSTDFEDYALRESQIITAYGGVAKHSRPKGSKHKSNGRPSSGETTNRSSRSHKAHVHTPRHEAHDKAHARLNANSGPVYFQKVTKNHNRTKKPNPPQNSKQNIYSTDQSTSKSTKSTVPTVKEKGCCCCCTIL
ncbi:unnamed protein product [Adineta steineri]|uniref:Uncharacterized protein n=2 Tax=Adineta steineri TaxID=433720 RepID=A0A813P8W5_9BILA|nr:unnamed protein product [Adineta steineri]CAF0747612.1 unnamed protein product [Adineta steineri]CAF3777439.1 unnamed protein product [Adineta steineri]